MLSVRLIRLVEDHSNEIMMRVAHRIRNDPHFSHIRRLPEAELHEWVQNVLANLYHWLADAREEEVAAHYEAHGRLRFEEEVPLHECVRGVCVLKQKVLDFVQEQGLEKSSLNLYAEEELENRLGRFFDLAICGMVSGYERAMRKACKMAAVV